jgi:hypothetical protein
MPIVHRTTEEPIRIPAQLFAEQFARRSVVGLAV